MIHLTQKQSLIILFLVEMWERFSYYGMRAILVLFLVDSISNGGMGLSKYNALYIYQIYTFSIYGLSSFSGLILKNIGHKKGIIIGCCFLCLGHLSLTFHYLYTFLFGLFLIAVGSSFLKPSITTSVGLLYEKGDIKKDQSFYYFYQGINLGAMFGSIMVGYIGEKIGWSYGFMFSSLAMFFSTIIYMFFSNRIYSVIETPKFENKMTKETNFENTQEKPKISLFQDIILNYQTYIKLLFVFVITISVDALFEQAGGFINLWTNEYVNRSFFGFIIPSSWFQAINPIVILVFANIFEYICRGYKKENVMSFSLLVNLIALMPILYSIKIYTSFGFSSIICIVLYHVISTFGELILHPVSLSYITGLKTNYRIFIVCLHFTAIGFGCLAAGELGKYIYSGGSDFLNVAPYLIKKLMTFFFIVWLFIMGYSKLITSRFYKN